MKQRAISSVGVVIIAIVPALLGSPEYEITAGTIRFRGEDITDWDTDVRGKAGMFLAFQYPQQVQGVSVINFLRQALSAVLIFIGGKILVADLLGLAHMDPLWSLLITLAILSGAIVASLWRTAGTRPEPLAEPVDPARERVHWEKGRQK